MENSVKMKNKDNPKMTFDIKGSTHHRKIAFDDKWWLTNLGHKKCMKCRNFVEINNDLNQTLIKLDEDKV